MKYLLLLISTYSYAGFTSDHVFSRKLFWYSVPLAIIMVVLFRVFKGFHKNSDNNTSFICPSCEKVQPDLNIKETHKCPSCGDELVKLEGFHDGDEE